MSYQLGRLMIAGVCCLAAAPWAAAQPPDWQRQPAGGTPPPRHLLIDGLNLPNADAPRPSHRPLDRGIGDLNGAEDLLAQRLGRTHDVEALQDLIRKGLDDPNVLKALQDQFKDLKPEQIQQIQETIKKHPELLDDPKLREMLKQFEQHKQDADLDSLPEQTKEDLAKWAKDFIDKSNKKSDPDVGPIISRPPNGPPDNEPPAVNPTPPSHTPIKPASPPESTAPPSGFSHDMIQGAGHWIDSVLDRSPEGEALRTAAMKELGKMDFNSSGASSDFSDFLKRFLSSDTTSWLANNLKMPSAPNLSGWSPPVASAGPSSLGAPGASGGAMDAVVWVAVLALLGAAAWMAVVMARRQAAAARAKPWSPGPWPVPPSQVSTRADLIRAFEHLAYLLLGRKARTLNHLDAATRLADKDDDRKAAASRLARLYEQARYAPQDEPLPADELTAARGDLSALAGAAA
jgi:hypothetical protein